MTFEAFNPIVRQIENNNSLERKTLKNKLSAYTQVQTWLLKNPNKSIPQACKALNLSIATYYNHRTKALKDSAARAHRTIESYGNSIDATSTKTKKEKNPTSFVRQITYNGPLQMSSSLPTNTTFGEICTNIEKITTNGRWVVLLKL